jgi:aromatic-L-amino-acid decarboxylase
MIRNHIGWARDMAGWIEADARFELVTTPSLSLLTFRYTGDVSDAPTKERLDDLNAELLRTLNDGGQIYLTQTRHDNAYVIRFQVGQLYTEEKDVRMAWDVIREGATRLGDIDLSIEGPP